MSLTESVSNRLLQNGPMLSCEIVKKTLCIKKKFKGHLIAAKFYTTWAFITFNTAMMSGDRWKAANMKSDSLFLTYKNAISENLEYTIGSWNLQKSCQANDPSPKPDKLYEQTIIVNYRSYKLGIAEF